RVQPTRAGSYSIEGIGIIGRPRYISVVEAPLIRERWSPGDNHTERCVLAGEDRQALRRHVDGGRRSGSSSRGYIRVGGGALKVNRPHDVVIGTQGQQTVVGISRRVGGDRRDIHPRTG